MDFHVSTIYSVTALNSHFHSVEGALTRGVAIIGWFLVIGFPDQMLASGKRHGFT